MQAARGGRKPETYSSGDSFTWMGWRNHFTMCARINGWNNKRARLEIEACMTGAAQSRAMDVFTDHRPAVGADENLVPDYNLMLDALEARFMPAAASDLARSTFKSAKQTEDESVLDFHARLRTLFRRAYPNVNAAAVETDLNLIDSFCGGLLNPEVRADTIKQRPQTYAGALATASNMAAAAQLIANEFKREAKINAMANESGEFSRTPGGPGPCFCCNGAHQVKDCNLLNQARAYFKKRNLSIVNVRTHNVTPKGATPGPFRATARGRGGRGASRGRGSGRRRGAEPSRRIQHRYGARLAVMGADHGTDEYGEEEEPEYNPGYDEQDAGATPETEPGN